MKSILPDGNGWLLQEITMRLPSRTDPAVTKFASASDLANAMRRASKALGEHEARTGGQPDENWPDCRVHGRGASRDGTAAMNDYEVIVIGGAPAKDDLDSRVAITRLARNEIGL